MGIAKQFILVSAAVAAAWSFAVSPVQAAKNYGCFKVTAAQLNIRERPYSNSDVVGTATKGEILEKRKFICTPRGYWCAIRKGDINGYADKKFMEKVSCP